MIRRTATEPVNPRKTLNQKLEEAYKNGLEVGELRGKQGYFQDTSAEERQLKIQQIAAVTALVTATTANLSKAGYLISQLNKTKGW